LLLNYKENRKGFILIFSFFVSFICTRLLFYYLRVYQEIMKIGGKILCKIKRGKILFQGLSDKARTFGELKLYHLLKRGKKIYIS